MKKLPKISLYKIILPLLFFFAFLLVFNRQAFAYNPGQGEGEAKSTYSEQFIEGLNSPSWEKSSFDFTTVNNIIGSISTNILGSNNPELTQAMGGSFVGGMNNLITAMYTSPPASSKEYFADLGTRLKIIKPTYGAQGQGIGFQGLAPIMEIWKTFRNLAYIFFTIVFILTGFAIMFRLKINPQTVVTIQNALPKIIISLILVTFSYAIAGFMIDLIYVVILLISSLIGLEPGLDQNIFGLTTNLLGGWKSVESINLTLNEFTGTLFQGVAGKVLGFAIGGLGTAVIAVAIAFSVFKIFFSLLISYISIIAGVIFSPVMLMLEAVPGQKGLNNWLKLMVSNIIPFPLVAAMFGIGGKLMTSAESGNLWIAPFLGSNYTTASIQVLIGVAIVIATPTVISSVQKSIGAPGIGGIAAGVAAPIAAAGKLIATPVTYPVGRAKAGMEKAYETQVAEGYQGGIRSGVKRTFAPWSKTPPKEENKS